MILYAVLLAALVVGLWQVRRLNHARLAAQAANTAKSEFVANVGHELRTPLNAILGMTKLLQESGLDAGQRGMLDIVHSNAEVLLALINGVLDFAALESGRIRPERTVFALRNCVESALGLVRPQLVSKELVLEVSIADHVPARIVGDPLRLHQILLYLLGNAVKFTETGKVRLEVSVADGAGETKALLFRVVDTGIGIDAQTLNKLFTPFTQADSASTRRYQGVGLGLATVRRLVQLMEGSVGAQSEPGRGSTFWFLLPMEAIPESPAEPALTPQRPRGRILVVDDNPINQLVAQRALERLGYQTDAASSGEDALAAVQAGPLPPFDAILLDCQMPGMDGYQTAKAIRDLEKDSGRVPIIALTAHASVEDREKCLAIGMDDYLAKPLEVAALTGVLERWTVTSGEENPGAPATRPRVRSKPPDPPNARLPTPLRAQRLPW